MVEIRDRRFRELVVKMNPDLVYFILLITGFGLIFGFGQIRKRVKP